MEETEDELDPRVQEELEKLNIFTEEINQLELQLEEANSLFRTLLTDSTQQVLYVYLLHRCQSEFSTDNNYIRETHCFSFMCSLPFTQ